MISEENRAQQRKYILLLVKRAYIVYCNRSDAIFELQSVIFLGKSMIKTMNH